MSHADLPNATRNRFPSSDTMGSRNDLFLTQHGVALFAAIDALYAAFEGVRLSEPFVYCPHCYTESDARYVRGTPLRKLTFADAAFILPETISTLGTSHDFNYFIPRILETLAYQGHYMGHVLPGKIALGREVGWTRQQLDTVLDFMRAYVAAASEMLYNTSICYDFERDRDAWCRALPEIADELHVTLNDPEALP